MSSSADIGIVIKQRAQSVYKEIFRKSIHICSAFVPALLSVAYYPVIILLNVALLLYTVCEVLRYNGHTIPIVSKVTEIAARKRDENKFVLGPVTLVLGILIAVICLPEEAAKVGIFALSFGDGTASLVGKLIGKVTIPGAGGKTVAGSLACFLAVFISCFCVSGNCLVSLLVAVAAMLIEVLPLKDFDNFLIPICIGSLYLVIQKILVV